jgi:hypothetical protein
MEVLVSEIVFILYPQEYTNTVFSKELCLIKSKFYLMNILLRAFGDKIPFLPKTPLHKENGQASYLFLSLAMFTVKRLYLKPTTSSSLSDHIRTF